jgi:hypothetical protein
VPNIKAVLDIRIIIRKYIALYFTNMC